MTFRNRIRTTCDGADDRGSILLAMLVVLVASAVSALILPVLITQAKSTRFDTGRAQQLAAAQSGVEVAIARIRAAGDIVGTGSIAQLPCAPLTGLLTSSVTLRYRTTIVYYSVDPQTLTSAQLLDPTNVSRVPCVVGAGTARTPSYAQVTSIGTDTTTGDITTVPSRTVKATYVVQTTNANIAGGLIQVTPMTGTLNLCIDAGAGPWTAGSTVALSMQTCDATKPAQIWSYNVNLYIMLVASKSTSNPQGMCIDSGGGTPQVAGTMLTLRSCGTVTAARQQWSVNDYAALQGTTDGVNVNGLCLTVNQVNTPGSKIVLGNDCGNSGGYNNVRNWYPQATVGAGAAGPATTQLVNYAQFGRCLDVPGADVTNHYLIAWPCKQSPASPAGVKWNQKWKLPTITNGSGTGPLITTPGADYCLDAPTLVAQVLVVPCPSTLTPDAVWTVRTATPSYANSYQIESSAFPGNCLQPADLSITPGVSDPGGISRLILAPCSASLLQKWNAPANLATPRVEDQQEG